MSLNLWRVRFVGPIFNCYLFIKPNFLSPKLESSQAQSRGECTITCVRVVFALIGNLGHCNRTPNKYSFQVSTKTHFKIITEHST